MDNQTRNHLNLQKHIADQDHIIRVRNTEIAALRKRAEKAEQERDEARADLAEYVQAQALRTQPRHLTPDAITDEMIQRAHAAAAGFGTAADISASATFAMLTAALTEPPARPEGAEDIEALIRVHVKANPGTDDASIADWLAENGVRVVTEEMNR